MMIRFGSTTLLATLLTAALAGCGSSDNGPTDSSLTIVNQETFDITDIYLSPSGSFVTTDNLLGSTPLQTGDSITISVQCDTWDVEIIDSTGTDCYISDYNLCGTNDEWDLDDSFFNGCAATQPSALLGKTQVSAPKAKPTLHFAPRSVMAQPQAK